MIKALQAGASINPLLHIAMRRRATARGLTAFLQRGEFNRTNTTREARGEAPRSEPKDGNMAIRKKMPKTLMEAVLMAEPGRQLNITRCGLA